MVDMLSQLTAPLAQFSREHSAKINEMSQNIDPSNLEQVTQIRQEWMKVTMAMELQSAIMSRLEKAIDTMISKM